MAEPTFTRPLVNWLEKRRAKKAAEQQRTEGADQLAAVRDIFSLSTPTTGSEPVREETTQEEIPAETASLRDIFGPSAPAGREVVHEETPQETFTGTASFRDIFGPSSPMETENAPEPVVQQASADVTAEVGQYLPKPPPCGIYLARARPPGGRLFMRKPRRKPSLVLPPSETYLVLARLWRLRMRRSQLCSRRLRTLLQRWGNYPGT